MTYLLDTHVWLWMLMHPEKLSERVKGLLVDPSNKLLLSAASIWEISIKARLGKLKLPTDVRDYVPSRMTRTRTDGIAVQPAHALQVSTLPMHHRDPFDRMLIAQAQSEHLPIITSDGAYQNYDVEVLW